MCAGLQVFTWGSTNLPCRGGHTGICIFKSSVSPFRNTWRSDMASRFAQRIFIVSVLTLWNTLLHVHDPSLTVHSWRPCRSAELIKYYDSASATDQAVRIAVWTHKKHLPYILTYNPSWVYAYPIPTAENVAKISDSHISQWWKLAPNEYPGSVGW